MTFPCSPEKVFGILECWQWEIGDFRGVSGVLDQEEGKGCLAFVSLDASLFEI